MEDSVQFFVFLVFLLIPTGALLWLLLPRAVVEICAADAEDREQLGFLCDPESLEDMIDEIEAVMEGRHLQIWELDAAIRVLAKRGHVIIGPCRADIEQDAQAASLLQIRITQ